MSEKVSSVEADARISEIAELMARGKWMPYVHPKQYAEKWGVSNRTVRNYTTQAGRLLTLNGRDDLEVLRTASLARLNILSMKAEAKGDLKTAASTLIDAAKLAGLVRNSIEVSSPDGQPLGIVILPEEKNRAEEIDQIGEPEEAA